MLMALPSECEREYCAVELLERLRWSGTARCPRRSCLDVYKMTDRTTGQRNSRFLWRCRGCERQFSVRLGTLFEKSTIELYKWCRAYYEASRTTMGVTTASLAKILGIDPKSASRMIRLIRLMQPLAVLKRTHPPGLAAIAGDSSADILARGASTPEIGSISVHPNTLSNHAVALPPQTTRLVLPGPWTDAIAAALDFRAPPPSRARVMTPRSSM